ncbi:MAG: hypothetical protein ACI361_03525 [Atopobiaceae bacterium]
MKKRYVTEEGTVRTLEEIMRLCSEMGSPATDPALALWCFGAHPEDGQSDPAIDTAEFRS